MEKNNRKGLRKTVVLTRRLYHSLNNYWIKRKNVEFKEFSLLEYGKILPEDVKDAKRLGYIKKLELAEKGYVKKELAARLTYVNEKERLVHHDHKIIPIGNFQVMEGEIRLNGMQLGFKVSDTSFYMASRTHENIPLWKPFDSQKLQEHFAAQHPQSGKELRFIQSFLSPDISTIANVDFKRISEFYNEAVQKTFRSNTYFKNSVLSPNEDLLTDPKEQLNRQFHLPLSKDKTTIMTLTEATDRYFVFQSYLKTAPKPESLYFDQQEFRARFLDSGITLIAHLKHNLSLGVQNGVLHIGKPSEGKDQQRVQWDSFENRIQSKTFPATEKYYLSNEVISKKNFLMEADAIVLKSNTNEASLKKHYGTGQWYFSEVLSNSEQMKFRPIDKNLMKHINETYSQSKNFRIAVTQLQKNQDMQTIQMKP
tara:strand:+ start:44513 stop:45784 length:1272 start_codon:yes stop_codon:yes gene_type:complete